MFHNSAPAKGVEVCAPLSSPPAHDPVASALKRTLDLIVAISALLLFAPLLILIAGLVRLESPGPALFRQRRGGLGGAPFVIYKFRTMHAQGGDSAVVPCRRGDERLTRLGALLRRTSLDELPQLINVLRGDMSIVGPRPHAVAHDVLYGALLVQYKERARVKPGLTGLAQISGLRGEIADLDMMRRRVDCDLAYIRNWSLRLDLRLIGATATRVLFDKHAY